MGKKSTPDRIQGVWERFLKFSPGSAEVVRTHEGLSKAAKNPACLLQERSKGKYQIEWKERVQSADSASRRLALLRDWQRGELVQLAWKCFAQPVSAEKAAQGWTHLAEFVLETELELAKDLKPLLPWTASYN